MLNNPKWDRKISEEILTVKSIISWLEGKNPDEVYCYSANKGCMLFQYLSDKGVNIDYIDSTHYVLRSSPPDEMIVYPTILNQIAYGEFEGPSTGKHSFGAALTRARYAHDHQGFA